MRVQYVGPDEAILAGSYIQQGEIREVAWAHLLAARLHHPDGFVVLDELVPEAAALNLDEQRADLATDDGDAAPPADMAPTPPPVAPQPQKRRH